MQIEERFKVEEIHQDTREIHSIVLWNNGYTAYLQREDKSWERVNLKSGKTKKTLKPEFNIAKGVSGVDDKFWTCPEGIFSIICFDRDLRPIFLFGGNKKYDNIK